MNENLSESQQIKLYEVIKSEKNIAPYSIDTRLDRIYFFQDMLNQLNENEIIMKECKENLISEIEETKQLLDMPDKCRLSFKEVELIKERINNINLYERK